LLDARLEEIRAFVTARIVDLRTFLSKDVVSARAEVLKHVREIEMTPEMDGQPHYEAHGEWSLVGDAGEQWGKPVKLRWLRARTTAAPPAFFPARRSAFLSHTAGWSLFPVPIRHPVKAHDGMGTFGARALWPSIARHFCGLDQRSQQMIGVLFGQPCALYSVCRAFLRSAQPAVTDRSLVNI